MQAGYPGIDSRTTQAGVTACEAPVLVSVTAFIWFPELPGTFRGVFWPILLAFSCSADSVRCPWRPIANLLYRLE